MSIDIDEVFSTDKKAEAEGKWVSVGGAWFLLARAGGANTKFATASAAAMRPYARQQAMGKFSEDQAREVAVGPFVQHVLLGWKELNRAGQPYPYSKENAKKLLLEIPDLFTLLIEQSTNMSTFAPEEIDDAAKNL